MATFDVKDRSGSELGWSPALIQSLLHGLVGESIAHSGFPDINYMACFPSWEMDVPLDKLRERWFVQPRCFPSQKVEFLTSPGSVEVEASPLGSASELAEVLAGINDLAFQPEEDEYGLVRPSLHAYKHCMRILLSLALESGLVRPSDIGCDRNGAIRISWAADHREAELICPSEETEMPYLYYSSSEAYGGESELTPDVLLRRIRWAVGSE